MGSSWTREEKKATLCIPHAGPRKRQRVQGVEATERCRSIQSDKMMRQKGEVNVGGMQKWRP